MTPRQASLSERDKTIYKIYKKRKNMAEVGRQFNLTRERVRQILAKKLSPIA